MTRKSEFDDFLIRPGFREEWMRRAAGNWGRVRERERSVMHEFLLGATITAISERTFRRAKDVRRDLATAWSYSAFGDRDTPRGFYETERFG